MPGRVVETTFMLVLADHADVPQASLALTLKL
jgi:hypothetical protein